MKKVPVAWNILNDYIKGFRISNSFRIDTRNLIIFFKTLLYILFFSHSQLT